MTHETTARLRQKRAGSRLTEVSAAPRGGDLAVTLAADGPGGPVIRVENRSRGVTQVASVCLALPAEPWPELYVSIHEVRPFVLQPGGGRSIDATHIFELLPLPGLRVCAVAETPDGTQFRSSTLVVADPEQTRDSA
jgi:hypothetical protein